jgi:hypothetical protein
MSCGSCAAFAATGAHETCMLKAGARMNGLDLSEQGNFMIIFCYEGFYAIVFETVTILPKTLLDI